MELNSLVIAIVSLSLLGIGLLTLAGLVLSWNYKIDEKGMTRNQEEDEDNESVP